MFWLGDFTSAWVTSLEYSPLFKKPLFISAYSRRVDPISAALFHQYFILKSTSSEWVILFWTPSIRFRLVERHKGMRFLRFCFPFALPKCPWFFFSPARSVTSSFHWSNMPNGENKSKTDRIWRCVIQERVLNCPSAMHSLPASWSLIL